MFRRKPKEGGYKNQKIGNLVVEFVQLPHSIHGTDYKILNYTYRLCVEDGPCLFERSYSHGSDESMAALAGTIRMSARVEGEWHARELFYRALYNAWSKR